MRLSEEVMCNCDGSGALDGHSWTCPIRTGVSPAEAQRRYDARQQKETDRYFAEVATDEQRYAEVRDDVPEDEQRRVAELRERRLAGDRDAHYGHDLSAAVMRGWANRARKSARETVENARMWGQRGNKNGSYSDRASFGLAVSALIDVAVEMDLSADDIVRTLQSDCTTDGIRDIELRIKRQAS